jgi:GNAT superfamily N-acetyltransferase
MQVSIRQTAEKDLIVKLNDKIFPNDSLKICSKTVCWFVYFDGEIGGFCTGKLISKDTFYMTRAGILDKFRGKGVQKKMINVRVRYAKKIGCKNIITYVKMWNIRSFVNLIRCKFIPYIPEYKYADDESVYLIRTL